MPPAPRKTAAKAAPAKPTEVTKVDATVLNQESPGSLDVVDRSAGPQIIESTSGATYDISKAHPELVDSDRDATEARRARVLQTDAAMNAKDFNESASVTEGVRFELEFVESGLTAQGRVWKKGEILSFVETEETRKANADLNDDVWYELSTSEQKDRYGKVFFEKR